MPARSHGAGTFSWGPELSPREAKVARGSAILSSAAASLMPATLAPESRVNPPRFHGGCTPPSERRTRWRRPSGAASLP
jgi:hypothetical protein